MQDYSDPLSIFAQNIINDYHRELKDGQVPFPFPEPSLPLPELPSLNANEKIAIVGAGVGGLYAAMLLKDSGIPFEILEASGRVGGRLLTYAFGGPPEDHYDVGAMRFPDTPYMRRLFDLFKHLGVETEEYLWNDKHGNSKLCFNGRTRTRDESTREVISSWEAPNVPRNSIHAQYTSQALYDNAIQPFVKAIEKDWKDRNSDGWELMKKYDIYSTRGYMTIPRGNASEGLDQMGLLPYPSAVVDWIETYHHSTGAYDRGLTDTVMQTLAFSGSSNVQPERPTKWYRIKNGAQSIAELMLHDLQSCPVIFNSPVTAIRYEKERHRVTLQIAGDVNHPRSYPFVINTTPLSCMQSMDLNDAGMDIAQRAALRQLTAEPGAKIAVKFKSAWWKDCDVMQDRPIVGGQSFTDRMIRRILYPSNASTVLIVSYPLTQDALRLGALFNQGSETRLKDIIIRDLAAVHELSTEFLRDQWVNHHCFDWTTNPNSIGAFAHFGPSQYANILPNLTRPAADGRLLFAGENVSVRHGWIVGALDASWRAVHDFICLHPKYRHHEEDFLKRWGSDAWSRKMTLLQYAVSDSFQKLETCRGSTEIGGK